MVKKYSENYFELRKSQNFIEENLKNEETKFSETLQTGLSILKNEIVRLKSKQFPPEMAFKLYDTYGFPVDVTQNILNEKNIKLNLDHYMDIVKKHKQKQKDSWTGSGEKSANDFFLKLKSSIKKTNFIGYKSTATFTELLSIIKEERFYDEILTDKNNIFLIFEKTPFYAESGGQVGDSGCIYNRKGEEVCNILDTKKSTSTFS